MSYLFEEEVDERNFYVILLRNVNFFGVRWTVLLMFSAKERNICQKST